MSYKLYYFSIRGRGEQVRLFLHALALPFEDVIVNREEFLRLKKQGAGTLTFGSLPMLEDGDFRLCQGPVILSYLAHRHDVAPVLATANRSLWAQSGSSAHSHEGPLCDALQAVGACRAGPNT